MSLNKFTDTQQGIDLSLKIGCEELKALSLDVDAISVDNIQAESIEATVEMKAPIVEATVEMTAPTIEATGSLTVGDLTYPSTENPGIEFQYPTSDGTGTLTMLPSLPFLSYGFSRSSSAGGNVPLSLFGSFTEPDTNANLSSLPSQFYTDDPKGCVIQKGGLYRIVGSVRAIRGLPDASTYCAILVNGSSVDSAYTTISTTVVNTDFACNLTRYLQLNIGDRISMGLSGLSGGVVVWEYWRIDLEFIK